MSNGVSRIVVGLIGVPVAAGSAWACAAVAKYGVHLDPSGVNALAVAGAASGVSLALKLIHDFGRDHPRVAADAAKVERATESVVEGAVKVDPQIVQAAAQAEARVEAAVAQRIPASEVEHVPEAAPAPAVTAVAPTASPIVGTVVPHVAQ